MVNGKRLFGMEHHPLNSYYFITKHSEAKLFIYNSPSPFLFKSTKAACKTDRP